MRKVPQLLRQRRARPIVAAATVLTLGVGVASAATWSQPARPHPVANRTGLGASAFDVAQHAPDVSPLSAGAPAGALTLGVEPARASHPVPATPALIGALTVTGIPAVALNAYRLAATRIDHALPGCGLHWSLVAAIGRVESDHGQFGGAALQQDGTSSPNIIGPALNGAGFAYVHDTDHGQLDGDTVYDRAVGPMQFIPSTWSGYALDGNGDGTASPFDINDASLAAAHYLCVAGGDLRTPAGQRRAVLAYNHSDAYLAEVLALARNYATGVTVSGAVTGSTTGAVPAPAGDPNTPAAPGPAPAAYPARPAAHAARPAPHAPSAKHSTVPTSGAPAGTTPAASPTPAAATVPHGPQPILAPVLPLPTPTLLRVPGLLPSPSPQPCWMLLCP
jgi:membrane-bound lytic murein transglycosylase B